MTFANYLLLIPRPYLDLFEVGPYAPFLLGSLAVLGIVCLIAGTVLGIRARERGLLLFGLLALASYAYLAASAYTVNAQILRLDDFWPSLTAVFALQLGFACTLVYWLKDARLPASLLAVFTTIYAFSTVLVLAIRIDGSPLVLNPYVILLPDAVSSPKKGGLLLLGLACLLLGTVLGIRARRSSLLLFGLLVIATDVFFAVPNYAVFAWPKFAGISVLIFVGLQITLTIYLIYRMKGVRLAASLLAVFTYIYVLSTVIFFVALLTISHHGRIGFDLPPELQTPGSLNLKPSLPAKPSPPVRTE